MNELLWTPRSGDIELRRPLLVVAFKGLFDAAEAATQAVDRLTSLPGSVELADIDPESFFDFQEERPQVRIGDNGREIVWPTNRAWGVPCPESDHDLVVVSGIEPHLRWRTFAECLIEMANTCGIEMVITLGSLVGMAPHTRPLGVVGSAANSDVADRLGLGKPSYEGPTGLIGVLHDQLDKAGHPVVSLRVSVPHYVPNPPNPEATRSLLARLELITGVHTGHALLDQAALDWRQRIDAAMADDEDLANYVRQLETQVDRSEVMPTGDDLAAELEAFLRDQRDDS